MHNTCPAINSMNLKQYFAACRIVMINGYGEPFIHPQISEIISIFETYQVKIFTTTNLQHLPMDSLPKINKFLRE